MRRPNILLTKKKKRKEEKELLVSLETIHLLLIVQIQMRLFKIFKFNNLQIKSKIIQF